MNSPEEPVGFLMPVYNEENIIETEIRAFLHFLNSGSFENDVYVLENGSTDDTPRILENLAGDHPKLTVLHLDTANFGRAVKKGIEFTEHERNVLVHVDHWDPEFITRAIPLLEEYPLVQASKNLPDSVDRRPLTRRLLTWLYNSLLAVLLGFQGTDTTGLKAFRKSKILPVVEDCKLEREMLETELVIRCQRRGIPVKEVPVTLEEKRPQRDPLVRKIWFNAIDLLLLAAHLYTE